jgi:hypothetical protein
MHLDWTTLIGPAVVAGTSHNESTAAANWIKTTWPKATA